jgi:phosphate transport system substrate-binding protein
MGLLCPFCYRLNLNGTATESVERNIEYFPFIHIAVVIIFLLLIWQPFSTKLRRIFIFSLLSIILLVTGIFASSVWYKNDLVTIVETDSSDDFRYDDGLNLNNFQPFQGSLVKTLNQPSTLNFKIVDIIPRLDGATAVYPLYAAFVQAVYPPHVGNYERYSSGPDHVYCSGTHNAFESLLAGESDVVFLMDVSADQFAAARQQGWQLNLTPIGREAFVFIVNAKNPVSNLTQEQIRAIYSGNITHWSQVDSNSFGKSRKIKAYQRNRNSGSQTALIKIMGGAPIMEPLYEQVTRSMFGMYETVANYQNNKNALGYSFRNYIQTILNDQELKKVKVLKIDGVEPTPATIADGTYPFSDNFYAVTIAKTPEATRIWNIDNALKLINWITSPQGQYLVEQVGYIPLNQ